MSKSSLILTLALLVIIVSFLGIPSAWKTVFISLLAIGIAVVTTLLKQDIVSGAVCTHLQEDHKTDVFAQNSVFKGKDAVSAYDETTEGRIEEN